jgi:23S rRNA (guanine1835-N2)-methyltransferase
LATDTLCHTPFGDFQLHRYPARRDEPLRAWCAADLLLLEELHRRGIPGADVLVVNDEHAALCVALGARGLWTDSALSALALEQNLAANHASDVPVIWSTQEPPAVATAVVMRVPKLLPYFEYQLAWLQQHFPSGTVVLAAGMDKHLSPRTAHLLERYIGPTERHPGQRKARLFSASLEKQPLPVVPKIASYHCDALGSELEAMPNVFSQEKLDGGSRLLLQQLIDIPPAATLLDLACGNGVLGLTAFKQGLAAKVIFADESAMAVASARNNSARLFPGVSFEFHHGDGLADYRGAAADLILCNPPFHLNHAVDEYAGRRLLRQCARHLQPGGRLCLVANQHLDYLPSLKRNFSRVETLAHDRRFVVWMARLD